MKTLIATTAVMVATLFLVGCQTPEQVVDTRQSPVCPTCKQVTKTTPIAGFTYTKTVCPQCQSEVIGQWKYEQPYTGVVGYCETCAERVQTCPICVAKH